MKNLFTKITGACCVLVIFILTTVNVQAQYCTSAATDIDDAWMTNVTFAGIDNDSEASLYSDFTSISGTVVPGATYTFSATVSYGGFNYTEKAGFWIDWDQNEVFDASEFYTTGTCNTEGCVLTVDVEVPTTAIPGETRMRVQLRYGTNPTFTPCGTFSYDEVEDYSITVESGVCTPPNFTYTIVNDCEADNYDVTATLTDFGTSSFITVYFDRSDDVPVSPATLVFALQGQTVNLINDVPFGVTVTATISGSNPICDLTRNWAQDVCPVENDVACDAIVLECGDNLVDMPFVGGTLDAGNNCSGSGYADVWYTFTTDGSEKYLIDETQIDAVTSLYIGDDCGNLTVVDECSDFPENFTITEPGTYYYRVQAWSSSQDFHGVSLTCVPFDCPELLADLGSPCDDGDPNTYEDVLVEGCDCAGFVPIPGQICDLPLTITSIPYSSSGNTATYFDDYESSDVPPVANGAITDGTGSTTYLSGNEVVYSYTPSVNEVINISTTNDDDWVGLWVFTGCPFESTVGYHTSTSGSTREINDLLLTGGVTYYIVISTWESLTASTDYTLSITQSEFDCPAQMTNIGAPCDDGDANTNLDTINEDCECEGIPIPLNDLPCTATPLACGDTLTDQNLIGATMAFNDDCFGAGSGDIWYSFTAEAEQAYVVSEIGSGDMVVSLHQGDDCGDLVQVGECDDFPENFVITEAGDYFFRVRPYSSATTASVTLSCFDLPTNDEACTATLLECGDVLSNQIFAGATQSFDDACGGAGTADVWYTFVTNGNQAVTISETQTDVVVDLWSGDECGNLTNVESCSDFPESFTVTEAGTYYFRIRPWSTASTYGVSLTCADFATNDEPCTATTLECGDDLSGLSFAGATQSIVDDCFGSGVNDVWFTFTSDGSQVLTVAETETDVIVDLWEGDDCGNLTQVTDCDDFPEFVSVTEAGTYYFRIRPYSSATTYGVSLTCSDFPTNDEACTATPMACGDELTDLTFIGATQSFDDGCFGSGTADVWFSFEADGTQAYEIAETSSSDVVVDLWVGDECGNLTNVSPCDDFPESVEVSAAGTYYFRVRPYSSATSLSVSLTCSEFDCAGVGNIGNACDDGDPTTVNDVITADCECIGTPQATNDEACTATTLVCGDDLSGLSFAGSTQSVDDDCFGSGTGDVWFTFVADGTQTYYIEETESDVIVDLWVGDDCGALTSISDCVDFGENFTVTEAGTYYFRIRPYSSATTFGVALTCTPFECPGVGNIGDPCDDGDATTVNDAINEDCECIGIPMATNDEACIATELTCGVAVVQSTAGASQSLPPLTCEGFTAGQAMDVWFTFTADGVSSYTIEDNGGDDLVLEAFSSDGCDNLTSFACADIPETIEFGVLDAGVYYVRAYAYSNFSPPYDINIQLDCVNNNTASLDGSVTWNSSCGERDGTVNLYEPNTATLVASYDITVGATGAFSVADLLTGTFDVIVKVDGYLAKGVEDVVVAAGSNTLAIGAIGNGDVNNNNVVNLLDFSLLNTSFGTAVGNPSYNVLADLNCDGVVNLIDVSIFNISFAQAGAAAPL